MICSTVFILFLTIINLPQQTFSSDEGEKSCVGNNGILNYEVGKSYKYDYESISKGIMPFHITDIKVKGQVILTPLSECQFILTLDETFLSSSQYKESEVRMNRSSVKFTMNLGIVEEVLSDEDDPVWSLNIKKAIVSMMINKIALSPKNAEKNSEFETSVFGNCETDFEKTAEDKFQKVVHLKHCGEGEGSDLIFQGVPYSLPLVTNKPIFRHLRPSHRLKCTQLVNSGIYSEIRCEEPDTHHPVYITQVTSTLKYTSSIETIDKEIRLKTVSSILFNYKSSTKNSVEVQNNSAKKVAQLLSSLELLDSPNKAEIFIELKKALAKLGDIEQFSELLKQDIHKKMFYDAVAEITTDEAIQFLATRNSILDTRTKILFYINSAFASKPGIKALDSFKTLLQNVRVEEVKTSENSVSQQMLLGASGLAHQYCKMTNPNCLSVLEYANLVNEIAKHLKVDGVEEIVRAALHALGNLDALTPDAVTAIHNILTQDSIPSWIEILALDSFRRDPCQSTLKNDARKILANTEKNDEIRVFAYLALSRCIMEEDFTIIQNVFNEQGSSTTVGVFMASHIRNIVDSSSPSKSHLKNSISKIAIPEKVNNQNQLRASRFFEFSSFNEKHNFGFSGDATVIFIPGQRAPQFVSFNGTVDLYGRSFNFIEIGLSQRLRMKTMMYESDESPADWQSLLSAFQSRDSYYRLFGTTIGIGLGNLQETIQTSIVNMTNGMFIIDAIQPSTILDEELTFPSISGLPLTYDLQGVHMDSIKIELRLEGASDISQLTEKWETSELDFKINLNGDCSTIVKGSAGFGANTPISVGTAVVGKINQNSTYGIQLIKKDDKNVEMKINFPENILVSRDLYFDVFGFVDCNGEIRTIHSTQPGLTTTGPGEKYCTEIDIVGLKSCHSFDGSVPTSPIKLSHSLEKMNEGMQSFDLVLIRDYSSKVPLELRLSTPGSDIKRELKFKLGLDNGETPLFWETKDVSIEGQLGPDKFMGSIKLTSKETTEDNFIPMDYEVIVQALTDSTVEILNFKTTQPKSGIIIADAKFGGPFSMLGSISNSFAVDRIHETKPKIHSKKVTNHLQSTSGLFGNVALDLEWNNSYFGSNYSSYNTLSAKTSVNGRSYKLQQIFSDSVDFEKESTRYYLDYEGNNQSYTFRRVKDCQNVYKIIYTDEDQEEHEIDFISGYTNLPETTSHNATILFKSPTLNPTQLSLKGHLVEEYSRSLIHGNVSIQAMGLNVATVKGSLDMSKDPVFKINGHVDSLVKFRGNYSSSGSIDNDVHMELHYYPALIDITVDTHIHDDGTEFIEKSKAVVVDNRKKKTINSESYTVLDRSKRTLTVMSKAMEKEVLLSKFAMNVQLAKELLNGMSSGDIRLEDEQGHVYSTSINETIQSSDDMLQSNLMLDLVGNSKTILTYTWDLKYDQIPKDKYDFQAHVQSDKRLIMEFMGSPLDIVVNKDIEFSRETIHQLYLLSVKSNVSVNGNPTVNSDVEISGRATPEGDIRVVGFVQDDRFKFDGESKLLFKRPQNQPEVHNLTFTITRTDLKSGGINNILKGSINKSINIHIDPLDFEMTEVGKMVVEETKEFHWLQLVRFHDREFTLFKEINSKDGETQTESVFMIDFSAKIVDENDQTKLYLKSNHNLYPDCPIANVNFTLSK